MPCLVSLALFLLGGVVGFHSAKMRHAQETKGVLSVTFFFIAVLTGLLMYVKAGIIGL